MSAWSWLILGVLIGKSSPVLLSNFALSKGFPSGVDVVDVLSWSWLVRFLDSIIFFYFATQDRVSGGFSRSQFVLRVVVTWTRGDRATSKSWTLAFSEGVATTLILIVNLLALAWSWPIFTASATSPQISSFLFAKPDTGRLRPGIIDFRRVLAWTWCFSWLRIPYRRTQLYAHRWPCVAFWIWAILTWSWGVLSLTTSNSRPLWGSKSISLRLFGCKRVDVIHAWPRNIEGLLLLIPATSHGPTRCLRSHQTLIDITHYFIGTRSCIIDILLFSGYFQTKVTTLNLTLLVLRVIITRSWGFLSWIKRAS